MERIRVKTQCIKAIRMKETRSLKKGSQNGSIRRIIRV